MICEQKGNLVYTKWHDKRAVNILSTNFDPLEPKTVKGRRKKNGDVVIALINSALTTMLADPPKSGTSTYSALFLTSL